MRIGIVSVSDGRLGDGLRIKRFESVLSRMGFDVVVLHPLSCSGNSDKKKKGVRPMASAVQVWNTLSRVPIARRGNIQVLLYKGITKVASRRLLSMVKKEGVDMLQAETQAAGELALQVKKQIDIPLFLDIHSGSYADEAQEQIRPPAEFMKYMQDRESEAIRESDEVFVVSNEMKNALETPSNSVSVTVVPNGADIHPGLEKSYCNPLRVAYAGNFSYWERIHDYLDAIKLLPNGKYDFYLSGDGVKRQDIVAQMERDRTPIEYLGYLPRTDYEKFMERMHVGIAPNAHEKSRIYCCPIKLFEYMSFGLPVVCAHLGEWPQILDKHDCGIVVPPENPEALAGALQLYEDEDFWWRHSQNAMRLIAERFSWDRIIGSLAPIYEKYIS